MIGILAAFAVRPWPDGDVSKTWPRRCHYEIVRPSDTSSQAWIVFLDLQRRMTPSEKFRRTLEFSDAIRRAAKQGLRQRYPNASERELLLKLAQTMLGSELVRKVYGESSD